jgi:hypothetical protein
MPKFLKLFHKIVREGREPNSLCEVNTILIKKSNKENYQPISLVSINTKILIKISANQLQQHIKKIIQYDWSWFSLGIQK